MVSSLAYIRVINFAQPHVTVYVRRPTHARHGAGLLRTKMEKPAGLAPSLVVPPPGNGMDVFLPFLVLLLVHTRGFFLLKNARKPSRSRLHQKRERKKERGGGLMLGGTERPFLYSVAV